MTPEQQRTIRNERAKLLAQALDRASTACLLVGLITPLAGGTPLGGAGLFALCAASLALHLAAQAVLGALR